MTWQSKEQSQQEAQPVEFYDFIVGTNVYRYTSSDQTMNNILIPDSTTITDTYTALEGLMRSNPQMSDEDGLTQIKITLPQSTAVVLLFLESAPDDEVRVIIRQKHLTDADNQIVGTFRGFVIDVAWLDNGLAELVCALALSRVKRPGLWRDFGVLCQHTLGDSLCGVDLNARKVTTTAASSDGINLTSADFALQPDGYWVPGYVRRIDTGLRRWIVAHTGSTVTLAKAFPASLTYPTTVEIFPGCRRRFIEDCVNVYGSETDNGGHFGGAPFVPADNPFDPTTLARIT
jgi:hypothetical protein